MTIENFFYTLLIQNVIDEKLKTVDNTNNNTVITKLSNEFEYLPVVSYYEAKQKSQLY